MFVGEMIVGGVVLVLLGGLRAAAIIAGPKKGLRREQIEEKRRILTERRAVYFEYWKNHPDGEAGDENWKSLSACDVELLKLAGVPILDEDDE